MAHSLSILFHLGEWNPAAILPVVMILGGDLVRRSQSIPGVAPFSIGWPEVLLTLLACGRQTVPVESPCTVINIHTGYARTNRSPILEHLLQSHASAPAQHGLTITFLYTSERPGGPGPDSVAYAALTTIMGQLAVASALPVLGVASSHVLAITGAGISLSTLAGLLMSSQQQQELHSARAVPPGRRDVGCITNGNGSAEAVVVINEGGGLRVEDVAAGRSGGFGFAATVGVGVLATLWLTLLLALTTLERADAWSVLALSVIGTVYATYAARTWRGSAALGFKFSEEKRKVVRANKVMEALMKAEETEAGVGLALLPVFFPGKLRPDEELWWAERKQAPKAF